MSPHGGDDCRERKDLEILRALQQVAGARKEWLCATARRDSSAAFMAFKIFCLFRILLPTYMLAFVDALANSERIVKMV